MKDYIDDTNEYDEENPKLLNINNPYINEGIERDNL